jgi:predicted RNA binding protein YcfA (HicA-like mRNA interferase family)
MKHKFKQKLVATGWQFKRYGKGSHEIWFHALKGSVTVSLSARRGCVSKAVERRLFCENAARST